MEAMMRTWKIKKMKNENTVTREDLIALAKKEQYNLRLDIYDRAVETNDDQMFAELWGNTKAYRFNVAMAVLSFYGKSREVAERQERESLRNRTNAVTGKVTPYRFPADIA